ncbi:ankyrin repeat and sterile alpha motif domain containing 3 [Homo sapiens]|uniref:Ankyrin repeat and sterile alpha motif domain containing 3 n=1 Tax=Homo sapiens TaxID=9606 RepID=K7EJS9_HUMAN|nr:ankyrin repeat and sterile alpha motif domain containing 3 [Homo sapiens]KAI4053367.1 ankyrin repeat and sterile alpha motif domain containing 3 [Homo sapiens]
MSELSDEASEPELLNRSLSMWHGLGTQVSGEELDVPLDLHTAASIGQYEVVKECVQREPICGFTPLMEAAAAGHEIIVQYFLNHGVKVDARDHSGATARMLAKQYGHMKIVALMDTYSPSLPKSLYRSPEKYEDLSSSDESCPAPQRQRPCRKKGVSIHEGPRALARITGIGLGGRAPRPRYGSSPWLCHLQQQWREPPGRRGPLLPGCHLPHQ